MVTLIDSARGLLRAGSRAEVIDPPQLELMPGGTLDGTAAPPAELASPADHPEEPAEPAEPEPGLGDLEAAVELVSAGLATRVVLTGFPSWPGLLWHAYRLAESANVVILPTVVRPGGRVDIVITRDSSANG
jgi:hypothetical protein